ncbi:hypothetical protein JRO89_XS01G0100800 [Xanthoceras sorbifolium]|uniref:Receptor ligand binding region domain-containing protein n=1 Tax=Xanthoceras sorbifolium TaxID=99658 RepID=A0ABQ8IIX7_9ROSI|nr:hypothetical protein JRO89_XS01G0100800 [Xanthoceras sorbifolium]
MKLLIRPKALLLSSKPSNGKKPSSFMKITTAGEISSSQDANIHSAHRISTPPSSSDEHIIEKLSMIKTLKTNVFVVNMSHSLASRFSVESMQGVVGFRPYIPPSKELHNFTLRWRRKMYIDHPNVELDSYVILAYDTVWALAEAAQKLNSSEISHSGLMFYEEIMKGRWRV